MKKLVQHAVAFAVFAALAQSAAAAPVYLRSTLGQPWGQTTNESAMDSAFGAGNWTDARFETVNVASLFTAANRFIFMEGGDSTANEMEAFLGANAAAMSAWVNAGGRLFLNAAPNEGDGMSYGFGVTLNYPDFNGDNTAVAVNPLHPIFNGVATNYTGTSFSHASVSGAGLTSLINDGSGSSVLAEMQVGSGLVLFGGMTTTNFHNPNPDAFNLRVNMLDYAEAFNGGNNVPEPASFGLAGLALLGLSLSRRSRK